jgi:hypothetical protein
MRKILIALCTALPLLFAANTAPAQGVVSLGSLICSAGVATLLQPDVNGDHTLWNFTIINHWPPGSAVPTFAHWAPPQTYTPRSPWVTGSGGWDGSAYTFSAFRGGRVTTVIMLFDLSLNQWLVGPNGETQIAGPDCDVL